LECETYVISSYDEKPSQHFGAVQYRSEGDGNQCHSLEKGNLLIWNETHCQIALVEIDVLYYIPFFFALPKKEPKKSSLMLIFCKIKKPFPPPHPDHCVLWMLLHPALKPFLFYYENHHRTVISYLNYKLPCSRKRESFDLKGQTPSQAGGDVVLRHARESG
jgi:hypothetical protein